MIGILDYGAGNLTSVMRALKYLGYKSIISSDPEILKGCERIIFPGVGAAGQVMKALKQNNLNFLIKEAFEQGKPVLGICIGAQVIFEHSDEDNGTACLGLVMGDVKPFKYNLKDENGSRIKIPHMGWNSVDFKIEHPLFSDIPKGAEFYFVHSYYVNPTNDSMIAGTTSYGVSFVSAIVYKNLVACQFHLEKSGAPGLAILEKFCTWSGKDA